MKRILCAAVVVSIEVPEDDSAACSPLVNDPLDELAARLRREACHGRDCRKPGIPFPGVTVGMAAAYQECCQRN